MEITKWAQEYFQKTLSVNTIHHAIRRCRIKLYRSKKKPYLNMIQKRRRFLWAKAHLKWTVAKWKTVLWSDESKFEVLFGKLGRQVIRTKKDKDNPSCYQRSVQKPASLMVWACMSACGMGSLHIWKGTINTERYIQVLEQHMLRKWFVNYDRNFIFGWTIPLNVAINSQENVSGYVCNHGSPSGERDTASPRGRYGERLQRDSCLKIHM